jgi:hypothetical protein
MNFRFWIPNDTTSFRDKTLLKAVAHKIPKHTDPVTMGSYYKALLPG